MVEVQGSLSLLSLVIYILDVTPSIFYNSSFFVGNGSSHFRLFVFLSSFGNEFSCALRCILPTAAISSSYTVHSGHCLLARSSFGSFVIGLLHKSIVFASLRL